MRTATSVLAATAFGLVANVALAAPPACHSITVENVHSPNGQGVEKKFSATQISDVGLRILAGDSLKGDHLLEWRIFDNTGALYQSITMPIGDAPGTRAVPGYPNPVRVVVPVPTNAPNGARALMLEQRFPIGGTMIQTNSLYGTWRLDALLDGQPYCKPFTFQITH